MIRIAKILIECICLTALMLEFYVKVSFYEDK